MKSLFSRWLKIKAWILMADWRNDRPNLFTPERSTAEFKGELPAQDDNHLSMMNVRLNILGAELVGLLYEDFNIVIRFEINELDPNRTRLRIGERAFVTIDAVTGMYAFAESGGLCNDVFITSSDDRLVDHIVSFLAREKHKSCSRTSSIAIRLLVGQTIQQVEYELIIHTLRYFHGNREKSAQLLEISPADLRKKLRTYVIQKGQYNARE